MLAGIPPELTKRYYRFLMRVDENFWRDKDGSIGLWHDRHAGVAG